MPLRCGTSRACSCPPLDALDVCQAPVAKPRNGNNLLDRTHNAVGMDVIAYLRNNSSIIPPSRIVVRLGEAFGAFGQALRLVRLASSGDRPARNPPIQPSGEQSVE